MGSLSAKARVGRGLPAEAHGYPPAKAQAGWGCRREVRWLECGRQGRGNKFPLPASRLPPWRYHHGPLHGGRPAKNRARLSTGSTPDTAAHQVSPRTDPAPGRGRGRSAEGAGGAGAAGEKGMGILLKRRGRGGGAGRSVRVRRRRRRRGRNAGEKCMGIFLRRRGRNAGEKRYAGDGTKARSGILRYTCGTCSRARRASMIARISGTVAAG